MLPPGSKYCAQETHILQRLESHDSLAENAKSFILKSVVLMG